MSLIGRIVQPLVSPQERKISWLALLPGLCKKKKYFAVCLDSVVFFLVAISSPPPVCFSRQWHGARPASVRGSSTAASAPLQQQHTRRARILPFERVVYTIGGKFENYINASVLFQRNRLMVPMVPTCVERRSIRAKKKKKENTATVVVCCAQFA